MKITYKGKEYTDSATHAGVRCWLRSTLIEKNEMSRHLGKPDVAPGDYAKDEIIRYLGDPDSYHHNFVVMTDAEDHRKLWPFKNTHRHPLNGLGDARQGSTATSLPATRASARVDSAQPIKVGDVARMRNTNAPGVKVDKIEGGTAHYKLPHGGRMTMPLDKLERVPLADQRTHIQGAITYTEIVKASEFSRPLQKIGNDGECIEGGERWAGGSSPMTASGRTVDEIAREVFNEFTGDRDAAYKYVADCVKILKQYEDGDYRRKINPQKLGRALEATGQTLSILPSGELYIGVDGPDHRPPEPDDYHTRKTDKLPPKPKFKKDDRVARKDSEYVGTILGSRYSERCGEHLYNLQYDGGGNAPDVFETTLKAKSPPPGHRPTCKDYGKLARAIKSGQIGAVINRDAGFVHLETSPGATLRIAAGKTQLLEEGQVWRHEKDSRTHGDITIKSFSMHDGKACGGTTAFVSNGAKIKRTGSMFMLAEMLADAELVEFKIGQEVKYYNSDFSLEHDHPARAKVAVMYRPGLYGVRFWLNGAWREDVTDAKAEQLRRD